MYNNSAKQTQFNLANSVFGLPTLINTSQSDSLANVMMNNVIPMPIASMVIPLMDTLWLTPEDYDCLKQTICDQPAPNANLIQLFQDFSDQ